MTPLAPHLLCPTGALPPKQHLLFVHYNANSHGSFVDSSVLLLTRLCQMHDVYCLVPGPGPFTDAISAAGVKVIHGRLHENDNPFSYVYHGLRFALLLRKLKIDLVYLMDYVWWKPVEILICKLLQTPCIAHINYYKKDDSFRGFLKLCTLFVANSHCTAQDFISRGFAKQTFVVHNFVDPSVYAAAASVRPSLGNSQEIIIGYVGALQRIKGVHYLLDAFAETRKAFPQCRLVIAGKGKEAGYEDSLRAQIQELGLTASVTLLGQRNDIAALMKSFDLLVVPSLEETFGFVNIEAGAAGTPVIASRVGGIPEIIVPGKTGLLVEPANAHALSEALNTLLGNPKLRKEMGTRAVEHIRANFSPDAALLQYQEIFHRALHIPVL